MIATSLLILSPFLAAPAGGPRAPDGHPGLGANSSLATLLGVFRSPTDEEEALVAHLLGLESKLAVLEATTVELYRSRGLFALLDPRDEPSLELLHAVFRDFLAEPEPGLTARGAEGRLWAQLFLDVRFRARARVLEGWRADADTVAKGLAVLRAQTDGWVRMPEEEAQNVAARVDLAAAFLRARFRDLEALREGADAPPEVDEAALARLARLRETPPGPERLALLASEAERVRAAVAGMETLLFTVRLEREAERWSSWRRAQDEEAARLRAEARVWQPQTPEGQEAPHEIGRVKKTTRRREAFARALESLSHDPLDAEMAYAAAIMARFVSGTFEALSHYDRFLALRGIRIHDHRTWGQRELTDEEDDAIFFLQQFEQREGRPLPPNAPPPGPLGKD